MYQKLPFNGSHFQLGCPACCVRRRAQDLDNFTAPSPTAGAELHPLLAACSPHPCFLKDTNPPGSACKAKFPRQLRPFHIHCGVPGPSPTAVPSKLTSGPRALAGRAVAWGWWQQLHPGPMLGATLSGPTADFPLPTIPTPGTKEVFQAAKKSYAGSSFET